MARPERIAWPTSGNERLAGVLGSERQRQLWPTFCATFDLKIRLLGSTVQSLALRQGQLQFGIGKRFVLIQVIQGRLFCEPLTHSNPAKCRVLFVG
jgi:hypothetical protein